MCSHRAMYGDGRRVEVFCSKGMAESASRRANEVRIYGEAKVSEDLPLNFFVERYTESYVAELAELVASVYSGNATPVTGIVGRMPASAGYAAKRSREEHRPVSVSEIG